MQCSKNADLLNIYIFFILIFLLRSHFRSTDLSRLLNPLNCAVHAQAEIFFLIRNLVWLLTVYLSHARQPPSPPASSTFSREKLALANRVHYAIKTSSFQCFVRFLCQVRALQWDARWLVPSFGSKAQLRWKQRQ